MGEMKLKVCPFCGKTIRYSIPRMINMAKDVLNRDTSGIVGWAIVCEHCDAHVYHINKQLAESVWNTRPLEDALRAQLASRDALIERLVEAGDKFTANTFGVGEWYGLLETWQTLVAEWERRNDGQEPPA